MKIYVLFSVDDKARVSLGLPDSKKQTMILMHLEYRVKLLDHDFPDPISLCCMWKNKGGSIGYNGLMYIAIRSGKQKQFCCF